MHAYAHTHDLSHAQTRAHSQTGFDDKCLDAAKTKEVPVHAHARTHARTRAHAQIPTAHPSNHPRTIHECALTLPSPCQFGMSNCTHMYLIPLPDAHKVIVETEGEYAALMAGKVDADGLSLK